MTEFSSRVLVTPLKKIAHLDGDIFHGMKVDEQGFNGFGEAYFTSIHKDKYKGWKKHTKMVLNLMIPVGRVTFYIHDETLKKTRFITLGRNLYARITIPPGLWVAFRGEDDGLNLILNVASIAHDPIEAVNAPIESFSLNGDGYEDNIDGI